MRTRFLNNIIMFMLVSSTGGLLFVFNRNFAFLALASIIIISLFLLQYKIKKAPFYSSLLAILALLFLFAINYSFAINPQSLTKYLFFGITIFTTVLVLFYYNNQSNKVVFINSLYFILKLILIHSVFNFFAYFVFKDNLFLITSQYHESLTYNYLFYYSPKEGSIINLFGIDIHRNAGMFWEAGILQVYLNILFFLEISIFKREKKVLALIIFAILTTYSTTGLLLLILQIIYFAHKELKSNIKILLIIVLMAPLYVFFNANMNEKIYGDGESSFQKRLFDFTQPIFIAIENPLTGVGLDLDRFQELREEFYINSDLNSSLNQIGIEQKVETTSKGSTNSVMYMLAGMGFPTAFLFIYMFMKQQIITNHRVIWFIIAFISVMSEPLLFRPFFFMFIVSGFIHTFNRITSHKKQLL
jgi:O-antigen ligase